MDDISRRKAIILSKIVTLYAGSGDPVGSKLLQEFLSDITVSTATLRNEMAQMTELGLLEQPHTSAGRVPTVMGYRYFLNNLLEAYPISREEMRRMDRAIAEMDSDPDKAAEQAAKQLADFFGLGVIVSTPAVEDAQMNHFQLIKTGRYSAAVMGITSLGAVKSRVCRLDRDIEQHTLERVEELLNRSMCFTSADDLKLEGICEVLIGLGGQLAACIPLVQTAAELVKEASSVSIYRSGQINLLNFRETEENIEEVVRIFEDTELLGKLLSEDGETESLIGGELGHGYTSLSMVIGRYRVSGGGHGSLALVGPLRMDYANVIPRLNYYCRAMSETLAAR